MKNTPEIYDKQYYEDRRRYATNPHRYLTYAAACMDLSPDKVVVVGCGLNYLAEILRKLGVTAWGVDFSQDSNADIISDATNLAMFENDSVDLVVTTDLLEHLTEDDIHKAVREFNRIAPRQAHFICFADSHAPMDDDYHITLKDDFWWDAVFCSNNLMKTRLYHSFIQSQGFRDQMVSQFIVWERAFIGQ
jgi:hypothetical protein